jgi:hypothetical protein
MQLAEFKAWFEGYTEGLEGAPTKAQFDRIKEKVKEIDGRAVTETVFIDRYVAPHRPYWDHYWYGTYSAGSPTYSGAMGIGASAIGTTFAQSASLEVSGHAVDRFDSLSAMYALGKAEALAG